LSLAFSPSELIAFGPIFLSGFPAVRTTILKMAKVTSRCADKQIVRAFVCALALLAQAAASEVNQKQLDAAARMQESVRKQQASVRRQTSVPAATNGFFVLGWKPAAPVQTAVGQAATGDCDPVSEPELQAIVTDASTQHGVAAGLIRAMIAQESAGRACAVSPKGAQGLMQLMPATQADLGVRNPFDAAENVDAGTRYIRQLLDRYSNNLSLALAAYNAGPARVDEKSAIPDIPETQGYVSAILSEVSEQ
jgi:soluble lytic murein transglycosylase-like protein